MTKYVHRSDSGPAPTPGTLLWIGERMADEYLAAYRFSESQVAQIAIRRDPQEALRRAASEVRGILLASSTRCDVDADSLAELGRLYPTAARLQLLGTLCEGMCRTPDPFFGSNRHYWHRWNQCLPGWLASCGAEPLDEPSRARSLMVLASSLTHADPLLELAESTGATAIWCRPGDSFRVRNVDAVWWDDSVAGPASRQQWRQRIASIQSAAPASQHVWITNSPRIQQQREAVAGGVVTVVSKPFQIGSLMQTLDGTAGAIEARIDFVTANAA